MQVIPYGSSCHHSLYKVELRRLMPDLEYTVWFSTEYWLKVNLFQMAALVPNSNPAELGWW